MRRSKAPLLGFAAFALTMISPATVARAALPESWVDFTDQYCSSCHNDVDKEGGLDLTSLSFDPTNPDNFLTWVRIHDRVETGEMPPKEKRRPDTVDLRSFVDGLATALTRSEEQRIAARGRATQRRLNRYEYENALRDLFSAPWLEIRSQFPEDGEAHRFNKIGDVLDVSYVQMARYLSAADTGIRQVLAMQLYDAEPTTRRYYARDHRNFVRFRPGVNQNASPDRDTFPVLDSAPQPDVRALREPATVGESNPEMREREAVGWVHGNFLNLTIRWSNFVAPAAGRYKVRFRGYTVWVGPGGYWRLNTFRNGTVVKIDQPTRWYVPNFDDVSPGRRPEVITVFAQGAATGRRLGGFDLTPEPATHEMEVFLLPGETITVDASRFFRSRPTSTIGYFTNPLAERDGLPGVAFQWIEVEGPFENKTLSAGYRVLFDNLPLRELEPSAKTGSLVPINHAARNPSETVRRSAPPPRAVPVEVVSADPKADAERLLRRFIARAYRRPPDAEDLGIFLGVFNKQFDAGVPFTESMIAAFTAVLASPGFVFLQEQPGPLDDYAIASRLAFFLWNSEPDETLRARAARGELRSPEVLRAETERMLEDPKSARFVEAFLDYWLDLRKIEENAPSMTLYNDYYLDDWLVASALDETRLFFTDLLERDLPARNIVDSNFTYLNERLAAHYGVPGIQGHAMRRVRLPDDSVRGGLMTMASVLKVTANGTTTSPVVRGVWVNERILGRPAPPPPASVPAVDPDIRGAVTIREQLLKHSADESCGGCHRKIDPAGFALESFDVMGGWRERYRGVSDDQPPEIGIGNNGHAFLFHYAQSVDSAGVLPDGRPFKDVREFKRLILEDEPQIARNLVRQLVVYATGAPVRFADRARIQQVLDATREREYGVRSLIHAIVQSELFLNK